MMEGPYQYPVHSGVHPDIVSRVKALTAGGHQEVLRAAGMHAGAGVQGIVTTSHGVQRDTGRYV